MPRRQLLVIRDGAPNDMFSCRSLTEPCEAAHLEFKFSDLKEDWDGLFIPAGERDHHFDVVALIGLVLGRLCRRATAR